MQKCGFIEASTQILKEDLEGQVIYPDKTVKEATKAKQNNPMESPARWIYQVYGTAAEKGPSEGWSSFKREIMIAASGNVIGMQPHQPFGPYVSPKQAMKAGYRTVRYSV